MTRTAMLLTLTLTLIVSACDDDVTGPEAAACTEDTGQVSVTVGPGLTPVIDWEPACAVAMVLIEDDASDTWLAITDDELWDDPAAANLIRPPVTYGVVPAGATSPGQAEPLQAGGDYEVILWRIPPGSADDCLQVIGSACLMTIHPFAR